jgi:exodeoxyribonuclease V gamma subunit
MEILADRLAERLSGGGADPFLPRTVIVQSKGMARWVCLKAAERNGVAANIRMPFPKEFIFDRIFPCLPGADPARLRVFRPDVMALRIMARLPDFLDDTDFQPVRNYLGVSGKSGFQDRSREPWFETKTFHLCVKIAEDFDQYIIQRPEMITAPENRPWRKYLRKDNGHSEWQRALWLGCFSPGERENCPAALLMRFDALTKSPPPDAEDTTLREIAPDGELSIFGVSPMPLFFLAAFHMLSRLARVNFYHFFPSAEFTDQLKTPREKLRELRRRPFFGEESAEEEPENFDGVSGNELFASLDKARNEFFLRMTESVDPANYGEEEESELFAEPPSGGVLEEIQRDLLFMRPNSKAEEDLTPNVTFHRAHSPLRELEILHDNLLDMFQNDPSLEPRDIVALTPDISKYAPFIQAVFESAETEPGETFPGKRIPFTISDRKSVSESRVLRAFFSILELERERFSAPVVMDILETPSVMRKFGLEDEDIEKIKLWIKGLSIRWGINRDSRKDLGDFDGFSWEPGLESLLLGFAMGAENGEGVYEYDSGSGKRLTVPYAGIDDGDSAAAGKFLDFINLLLRDVRRDPAERDSAPNLARRLSRALELFFDPDSGDQSEDDALRAVQASIKNLSDLFAESGFTGEITAGAFTEMLGTLLSKSRRAANFLRRGVTFCELTPMRAVPFKVVCLIGMGDGLFPRAERKSGFSLISDGNRRSCDRDLRLEDRGLFMDAILSARSRLHVSWEGKTQDDNSPVPAAGPVLELMDYVRQKTGSLPLTDHPLQAFSPRCFTAGKPEGLFTYSGRAFAAAKALLRAPKTPALFFPPGTGAAAAPPDEVTSDGLVSFFKGPQKFLLRGILDTDMSAEDCAGPEDREPFEPGTLSKWQIRKEIFDALQRTAAAPDEKIKNAIMTRLGASGMLPPAPFDRLVFDAAFKTALAFHLETLAVTGGVPPETVGGESGAGRGPRVSVRLKNIYMTPAGAVQPLCFFGQMKGKYLAEAWVRHAALNAVRPGSVTIPLTLAEYGGGVDKDALDGLSAADAARHISELAELFAEGCRRPLPFFPEASFEFASTSGPVTRRLGWARLKWEPGEFSRGDSDDPCVRLCFPDWLSAASGGFMELAEKFFLPPMGFRAPPEEKTKGRKKGGEKR